MHHTADCKLWGYAEWWLLSGFEIIIILQVGTGKQAMIVVFSKLKYKACCVILYETHRLLIVECKFQKQETIFLNKFLNIVL